ncbi:P-loop containing nucleoside triphosphate hydrolase protein [Lactarius akahatsu]|uniref:P-loop containing nucleoside triphosphate hydrolase protein n=1 Tax=Lactarius akahatsu TaxID=416441 RepID=A0AAD4QFW0_9AGAM|nr:P-loop containing nucleoside triphosphate hydrolase protein [Lactarius akahatsu]
MGRNKVKRPTLPLKSKLKKDPGVPRLPDLKVRSAEIQRRRSSPLRDPPHGDATMASEPTLSSLAQLAAAAAASSAGATTPAAGSELGGKTKEQLRRHYIRALHRVVDEADVVLLVLDARDPAGCRSRLVEEEVRRREGEGKRLVFVLNKIGAFCPSLSLPFHNAQAWLKHLRHTTPTLPFRSAGPHQRTNLSSGTAPALLRLLKAYKPSAAQSMTVGVVGFPNVGKSSLINTLKRAKVCAVAGQAGHTKELQHIQLERGLRIVDSPGVIFEDDEGIQGQKESSVLLRNVVKPEDVDDPISVVEQILARTQADKLTKIYNLPTFTTALEFLTMLALSTGRLLRGGTPDILAAARQVLADWNHHKIPFFSEPPALHAAHVPSTVPGPAQQIAPGAEMTGSAQIVGALGAPFVLEGLFGEADAEAMMDAEPAADDAAYSGMDVEDEARGGMQIDDDDSAPRWNSRKRAHSPAPSSNAGFSGDYPDPAFRAPKRLRRLAVRSASIPTAAIAVRSRRAERQVRRKRERAAALHKAAVGAGMEVDGR